VHEDQELALVESIYEALDAGEPERALDLARRAPGRDEDPVLRFLTGVCLATLDRAPEAATELERAVRMDPDDVEFRVELAHALFRCCRFDEARRHADRAVRLDERLADAWAVQGLLLERRRDFDRADACFARAAKLDPERFPLPERMGWEEFERQVALARQRLPPEFQAHLERIGLIVEDLPADDVLLEEKPPLDPELLGLFAGVPLGAGSAFSCGGDLPPRIYLFKRNLERLQPAPGTLRQEIADTLYHELGHYLGMDEEDLEELDFA
jgi:predicted Zn-dependent protease with MMP-like domain